MIKVLVSPFDWGLGHATRDIPVIKELLRRGCDVEIANCGRPKIFLEKEFPELKHITLPPYPIPYTSNKSFSGTILLRLPFLLHHIYKERKNAEKLIEKRKYDLIISDNRFEICHPKVPSFLITHQIKFKFPNQFRSFEILGELFNAYYQKRFSKILVPDFEHDTNNLTADLSRKNFMVDKEKVHYCSPFCNIEKKGVREDIDYFISISGPEPQRTNFEKIILSQVDSLQGNIVINLGKPEQKKIMEKDNVKVYSIMDRETQIDHLNRAKMVISRSGYTTVMEILELGKKALFIPTPGQTEQEYLSEVYQKRNWFYSVKQSKIDLKGDLEKAKKYSGFPFMNDSKENVRKLVDDVIEPAL